MEAGLTTAIADGRLATSGRPVTGCHAGLVLYGLPGRARLGV